MKTLIDDFSVLAVEKCLLQQLPELFSPKTVISLDDTLTARVAAETDESRTERAEIVQKLRVLETALIMLRSLARSQTFGRTSQFSVPLVIHRLTIPQIWRRMMSTAAITIRRHRKTWLVKEWSTTSTRRMKLHLQLNQAHP
jgi:hypothetical protein